MKLYWVKTNWIIKRVFYNYIWEIKNTKKIVYLTFDDGPSPEVTNWVLKELKNNNVKASFFCIGDNIKKHPTLLKKIYNQGHSIGNHTYNHYNGWRTKTKLYIQNVIWCEDIIKEHTQPILEFKIFRPPYGKLKISQSRALRKLGYKIIMWDVLSADFDVLISKEKCLDNVLSNIKPGSIIVFHDSIKAFEKLKYALPKTIAFLKKNNFRCEVL